MEVRLLIWGAFGVTGFIFFLLMVELLRRFTDHKESKTARTDTAAAVSTEDDRQQQQLRLLRDFTPEQLGQATNDFSECNLVQASSKSIYGGVILDENIVVKVFSDMEAAEAEAEAMVAHSHSRLVPLLGRCCCSDKERDKPSMLIYKRMFHGDLATALRRSSSVSRAAAAAVEASSIRSSDSDESSKSSMESSSSSSNGGAKPLDWITRFKIAIGVAEALVYLHHECSPAVIHSDLKSSSVLLDDGYEVRLGSMGKAWQRYRQRRQDTQLISPVYDVYCYGKILLDLISGLDVSGGGDSMAEAWLQKALPLMDRDDDMAGFLSLVDPSLVVDEDHVKELMLLATVARSCIDAEQAQHQTMANILGMLQNPLVGIFG